MRHWASQHSPRHTRSPFMPAILAWLKTPPGFLQAARSVSHSVLICHAPSLSLCVCVCIERERERERERESSNIKIGLSHYNHQVLFVAKPLHACHVLSSTDTCITISGAWGGGEFARLIACSQHSLATVLLLICDRQHHPLLTPHLLAAAPVWNQIEMSLWPLTFSGATCP